MKINLEHRLASCPETLRCVVCQTPFPTQNMRALLYSGEHLIQGDVCPACLKLTPRQFKQKLQTTTQTLIAQIEQGQVQDRSLAAALELQMMLEEPLKWPSLWEWFWQHATLLIAETRELEAARLGSAQSGLNRSCGRQQPRLRITFTEDTDFSHLD